MDPNAFIIEPFDRNATHVVNAMSVDVEDYFQVAAFERRAPRREWDRFPHRVENNTMRVLSLLEDCGVRATFFTLGWVAERYPNLVRAISEMGHEVASHGMHHIRATRQTPGEFRDDVDRSRKLLEDVSAQPVTGYRAATFSIGAGNLWASDILQETGYTYSSSIYPVRHDLYGMREAPRAPFRVREGGLLEIPISTVRLWSANVPCGGGGYFRLLPYTFSKWALKRINRCDQLPAVFYFHPWEIDTEQPRINGIGPKGRLRHYTNLARMEGRLRRLFAEFKWDRMDRVYPVP